MGRADRRVMRAVLASALVAACCAAPACKRDSPPAPPVPAPIPTPAPRPTASTASIAPASARAPVSPGCGTAAPSPHGTSYQTSAGRTFHVWGPATYDPSRGYPVVLTFHGWYANGRDFEKWFKMEDYVEGAAFIVYPDSKGPTWDITGDADLDFAAAVVEAMANAYCIDRSHVFALGFSYGGKLVHHLGCKRPSLVRAISVGDGSWQQETGCREMPVLVTHRTRDHDELIAWGKEAAQRWAKIDGCSDATDATDVAHGCVTYRGCTPPQGVTFCEDTHFDASWPKDWNHTIRDEYRALTWKWFKSVR
jgi:poly(3-hydroxybutyrate) depolymerase